MTTHLPHRLLLGTGIALLLGLAAPASAAAQGYELPPCAGTPAPPPAPTAVPATPRCAAPAVHKARAPQDPGPTPAGGYTLPRKGFAVKMELGYPNLDVEFLFALGSRVQLGFGYRGLYSMNHSPYASLKWSMNSRNRDVLGLALQLRAGYSFPRSHGEDENIGNMLAGEYKWFGELWFLGTARRGKHGLFWGVGARISQQAWDVYSVAYDGDYGGNERDMKVMGTFSLELGYELRINRIASFFLALGVDIFATDEFIPALPRFRMGVMLGS